MSRISIDFSGSPPLKVGGLLHAQFTVVEGTKGLNLRGGSASTTPEEVLAALEDARDVVRGLFGAPEFDAAIVVIPNTTGKQNKDDIIYNARNSGFNITQLIREQVAVTADYIQLERPEKETTLAIISTTGGILEVSVITIEADNRLILRAHKLHDEPIDFEVSKESAHSSGGGVFGLVGGAVKALVVDPFQKAFDIFKNILADLDIGEAKVEKVVLVGKESTSEKVIQAAKESFRDAEVWEGIHNPDEVAAYGAAFLSFTNKELQLYSQDSATGSLIPEELKPY